MLRTATCATLAGLACGCRAAPLPPTAADLESHPVASLPTDARATDGTYISWREHRIDDEDLGGVAIRGGDGSVVADLDGDGWADVVSVHEADTEYDGVAQGHVRIAFGTESPDRWELVTLADGAEAGAAEDVAVGDVNGDGFPDLIVACELAHLIYFENPGPATVRAGPWARLIPPGTTGRGSFIRVFLADLTGDGRPEVVAANKGAQNPGATAREPKPISWFEIRGRPLDGAAWVEHELTRIPWPINSQPVDLDGDGDLDVVGGSVAESRILWFENPGPGGATFVERPIPIAGTSLRGTARPERERGNQRPLVTGFNMDFADLNGDGRLDVVTAEAFQALVWLEQPADPSAPWPLHAVGTFAPDQLVGLALADIDGDGDLDVMTGGYSRGPRDADGDVAIDRPLGRLAWFEQTGPAGSRWVRHDISRRKRGMFDQFVARDMDGDGDVDFVSTRGNSAEFDGVFWLEQVRTPRAATRFTPARPAESEEVPLAPGSVAAGG